MLLVQYKTRPLKARFIRLIALQLSYDDIISHCSTAELTKVVLVSKGAALLKATQ